MNSNNILDLLDDKKEVSNKEHLDDETIKKIFKKYIQAILIISIVFIIYGFLGKSEVPVANQTLYSRQEITDDMITMKKIPRYKLLKKGLIRYDFYITEKYVAYNKVIKEGSCFYENIITDEVETDDKLEDKLKDGYVLYRLPISLDDYEKDKVKSNDKIDIYFEYIDNNIKKIGKLVNDVRIIDVRDKDFLSIFEPSEEERIPKIMYLETSEDDYNILKEYEESLNIKLYYSIDEIETNSTISELEEYKNNTIISKVIPLSFELIGTVAKGKKIKQIMPSYSELIIRGNEDIIDSMMVYPISIDVENLSDDKVFKLSISKLKGIEFINPQTIEVQILLEDE